MISCINTDVYRVTGSVISYISELNNERTQLTLIVYFGVDLENELLTRINKSAHIFNKYYALLLGRYFTLNSKRVQLELIMLMSSQVPVVPLMKDNSILYIKAQTFLCISSISQVDVWILTTKIWSINAQGKLVD